MNWLAVNHIISVHFLTLAAVGADAFLLGKGAPCLSGRHTTCLPPAAAFASSPLLPLSPRNCKSSGGDPPRDRSELMARTVKDLRKIVKFRRAQEFGLRNAVVTVKKDGVVLASGPRIGGKWGGTSGLKKAELVDFIMENIEARYWRPPSDERKWIVEYVATLDRFRSSKTVKELDDFARLNRIARVRGRKTELVDHIIEQCHSRNVSPWQLEAETQEEQKQERKEERRKELMAMTVADLRSLIRRCWETRGANSVKIQVMRKAQLVDHILGDMDYWSGFNFYGVPRLIFADVVEKPQWQDAT
jgi:hypothetical protein